MHQIYLSGLCLHRGPCQSRRFALWHWISKAGYQRFGLLEHVSGLLVVIKILHVSLGTEVCIESCVLDSDFAKSRVQQTVERASIRQCLECCRIDNALAEGCVQHKVTGRLQASLGTELYIESSCIDLRNHVCNRRLHGCQVTSVSEASASIVRLLKDVCNKRSRLGCRLL